MSLSVHFIQFVSLSNSIFFIRRMFLPTALFCQGGLWLRIDATKGLNKQERTHRNNQLSHFVLNVVKRPKASCHNMTGICRTIWRMFFTGLFQKRKLERACSYYFLVNPLLVTVQPVTPLKWCHKTVQRRNHWWNLISLYVGDVKVHHLLIQFIHSLCQLLLQVFNLLLQQDNLSPTSLVSSPFWWPLERNKNFMHTADYS